MDTKYTPGPWTAEESEDGRDLIVIGAKGIGFVCEIPTPDEQDWANAQLIASAPDLVEALEAIERRGIGPDGHALANWPGYETATVAYELATIARAALAKAGGE